MNTKNLTHALAGLLLAASTLNAASISTDFSGVSRVGVAHTDSLDATNNGNRNVGISGATWTISDPTELSLPAFTGALTMGNFTWSNLGSGLVFTTGDGGVWRSAAGTSTDARTTGTSEADRANFQFNTGSVGGSAASPMDVAVFNLIFQVGTGSSFTDLTASFRAGTAQTSGAWDNNTVANNGDYAVIINPITIAGTNGTVDFGTSYSLGSGAIGAGAGPTVTAASTAHTLGEGTYLMQIRLSGQGGQRAAIDDFSFVAIPEPGTIVLVCIALGSLLIFRRRR